MDEKRPQEARQAPLPPLLRLSLQTLLVVCGPAGSGKSTFARELVLTHEGLGMRTTMIVSSDTCRALICDDETNQRINRDTFDLFYYLIQKRMLLQRFTIADSTALHASSRLRLLTLAQRYHYHTCLLIFDVPHRVCVERDQGRPRMVGELVIDYHQKLLQQTLREAPAEGWAQLYIMHGNERIPLIAFDDGK